MKLSLLKAGLLILTLLLTDFVFAATHAATADQRTGMYAGIGIGGGFTNNHNVSSSARHGLAWDANLGYQFNTYFALEGGYLRILEKHDAVSDQTLGGFYLSAKGLIPINPKLNLFGRVGAVRLKSESDSHPNGAITYMQSGTKYVPMLGLGIQYFVMPKLAIEEQYFYTFESSIISATKNRIPSANTFLFGISYHFFFLKCDK